MKYIFVKFLRDLKALYPQFISVFIMAMLSLTIFSSMSSVWKGMGETSTKYFEDGNLADIWVYGENITEEEIDEIRNLNYVKDAEGSIGFKAILEIDGKSAEMETATFGKNTKALMNPICQRGKPMEENSEGIWIDDDFAKANSIKAGDRIKINILGIMRNMVVEGTVLSPEYVYYLPSFSESMPNHELYGYAYIGEKNIKKFFSHPKMQYKNIPYNQIRLKINEGKKISPIKDIRIIEKDVESILGKRLFSVINRENKAPVKRVDDEINQIRKMAILFSTVFILLAVLTMYTTMKRLINNQKIIVGTMKALGFSKGQLYLHYSLYGFLLSLIGGITGILIGHNIISNIVLNIKKASMTLPEWKVSIASESIILLMSITFICTVASFWTVHKTMQETPAESMRGHSIKTTKYNKRFVGGTSNKFYEWKWVLRDVLQNKTRYIIGVIAIIGSITLMVAGIGIHESIKTSNGDVFEKQYKYDYFAKIKKQYKVGDNKVIEKKGVQFTETVPTKIIFEGQREDGMIMVLGKGDLLSLNLKDVEKFHTGKGAVISKKIAATMNIKKGDHISYKRYNENKEMKIKVVEISNIKIPQGLFVSYNNVENFNPDTIYFKNEKALNQNQYSIFRPVSIDEQKNSMDKLMESVNVLTFILIFASFLLCFVIIYNLGMVNYVERIRQYATMKVLGFKIKEIRRIILKECLITLVPGCIIGLPLSLKFLKKYVEIVSFDGMEWVPYISGVKIFIVLSSIIMFSVLINLNIVGKIKKIKMVEALKSVE